MKKLTLVLLVIMLVYGNCGNILKPDPNVEYDVGLPSISSIGSNTFGCKINEVNWQDKISPYTNNTHIIADSKFIYDKQKDSTTIIIKGRCYRYVPKTLENLSLQFKSRGLPKEGQTYILSKNAKIEMNYYAENKFESFNTDKAQNPEINFVTFIRVDTSNKIVSGSFEGQLASSTTRTSKLPIKDGRFDILFQKITPQ
jgi:hypothetical protein